MCNVAADLTWNASVGKVHIESNVSLLQNLLQKRWLVHSDLLYWIRCFVQWITADVKSICSLIKSHSTFVTLRQFSAGELSGKFGKKAVLYVVCHTYSICCGNRNTIWLTAVWTTHKDDRSVPSHFHSCSKTSSVHFPWEMVWFEVDKRKGKDFWGSFYICV